MRAATASRLFEPRVYVMFSSLVEAPTDAVPQILIRIQDSISALRSELGALRSDVGQFKLENETQHEKSEASSASSNAARPPSW